MGKAKFHYAIWFEAGSSLSATSFEPASNLSAASFEQVRAISTCRDNSNLLESKLVADRFEAKFHYAIWFDAGSNLVADLSQAC